jgi:iron complex outermembrane receptor protein
MSARRNLIANISIAIVATTQAVAQPNVEEITVTGSYVKRDLADGGAPLVVVTADDLVNFGLSGVGDFISFLPFNSGSEFNADVFTQNLSAGTSNFNLRGLGLNSTLVLLNGRRQTVSGGVADDGSTFVDINALVPLNAVERIEVLKDGAAALYGTDAVAGVVNVITRTDLQGWEAEGEYRTTTRSSQEDAIVRAAYGWESDRLSMLAAGSYLRRSWLPSPERDFTAGKGLSSFGQPGSFILLAPSSSFPDAPFGLMPPQSVIDPDCAAAGGQPREVVSGSGLGNCIFDFTPYYHLVPRERRWIGYASATYAAGDVEVFGDAGYASTSVERGTSPSFPILNLVTMPANNPGNVFNTPALFLGRPLGADAPVNLVTHDSDTWRVTGGGRGDAGGGWSWEVSASFSANEHIVRIANALSDRFNAALNGQGGPNNNQFFNPFGSAALSQPGDPTYNDPAVIEDFLSTAMYDYETSLLVFESRVTGSVAELAHGPVAVALGAQARREKITGDLDDQFNAENYLFLIGGPDFAGNRTVLAAYAEANIPLSAKADAQLALRHENYEGGIASTDPKISLSWRPIDWLTGRASFGTAFRAPSVFQRFSSQTVLSNISDPVTGSVVFRGVRTVGSDDLKPEQADVWNVGVRIEPRDGLSFDLDYWRFDYSNIIVKENAQAIVDANPFDPKIIREAGQILRIDTNYVNTPSVQTDGVDIAAAYSIDSSAGHRWSFGADLTYIHRYTIQTAPGGPKQDVAGSRNFRTFARSLPRWRSTISAAWAADRFAAAATVRTISSYQDDQNGVPVDSHITVDGQVSYDFEGPILTLGVFNALDQDPPDVNTSVGFDSKVHDPRGRVVYLRLSSAF